MTDLQYEALRQVLPYAAVVLAQNPSPMTLDGTNTWLLRDAPDKPCIVIDPGPLDEPHLAAVMREAGRVERILLTHHHPDHSAGAARLHELSGAPVHALDPTLVLGTEGLHEGDVVAAGGLELVVWATPGHSSDSTCFVIGDPGSPDGAVLTGDTVLGRGTTVIAHPDGSLGPYLDSLHRLELLGDMTVLPGHGPVPGLVGSVTSYYLRHRAERLEQVRVAVAAFRSSNDRDPSPREVVEIVYADVDQVLWEYAEKSVRAQLDYLLG